MTERSGHQLLTDEQLLNEIKRQWYEKGLFDYENEQEENSSPAVDYMGDDIEQHINDLEREYMSRGLVLPNRWEYVAEFS